MRTIALVLLVCVATTYAQFDLSALINPLLPLVDQALNQILLQALGSLGGLLSGKRDIDLLALYNQAQSLLQGSTGNLVNTLQNLYAQYGSQLQGLLSNLGISQAKRMAQANFLAAQVKGEITDAFNSLLNEALGHLTDIATNLANAGLAALLTSISGRKRFLESLGLGDAFNSIVATLSGTVDSISSSFGSLTGQLVDAVTPHIQDLQTTLINTSLDAAQSLLNTLANISQSIGK